MSPRRLLRSKFFRDAVTLQVGALPIAVGNLLSSVAVAHLLGAQGQGRFVVAMAMFALLFFALNLGLTQAAVSQVASASARGLTGKVGDWLAYLAKAYLFLGLLLIGMGAFLLPWAAETFYHAEKLGIEPRELGMWAWWLTLTPVLDMPRVVCCAAFQGTRRMLALAQVENATEVVRVFLVVWGALVSGTPAGAVLGTIAATAVGSLIALERYRRARADGGYALPSLREIAGDAWHIPIGAGLRLGLRIGVMRNIDALTVAILPPLIIQGVGGSDWVAYFRVAQNIMNLPKMAMQGVSRTALPALSELAGVGADERLRKTFWRVTLLSGGLVTAAILVCLPLVPFIVGLFYPDDYPAPVHQLSEILGLCYGAAGFAVALDSFYIVTDRLRVGILIAVGGFLVSTPLMIWLAVRFPRTGVAWGLGVALAWVVVHHAYILYYFRERRAAAAAAETA